jgi:hypothetical protein
MGSLPKVDDTGAIESLRKITQPLVSDIRIDSAVAIETLSLMWPRNVSQEGPPEFCPGG